MSTKEAIKKQIDRLEMLNSSDGKSPELSDIINSLWFIMSIMETQRQTDLNADASKNKFTYPVKLS